MKKGIYLSSLALLATLGIMVTSCSSNINPGESGSIDISEPTSSVDETIYYTVSFNLNGGHFSDGSTTYPSQQVKEGRWVAQPSEEPVKEHCTFLGWYAQGASTAWNFIGNSVWGDVELTAKWETNEEEKITITIDPNNGQSSYTYDGYVGEYYSPKTPSKDGFQWIGWTIKSTGESYTGYITASMAGETLVAQYEKSSFNLSYTVDAETNEVTITGLLNINATSVVIPDTINGKKVTKIGERAFASRISLVSISIPSTVKEIAENAFIGTYKLESFTVDSASTYFTVQDGILFSKDMTILVNCPTKAVTTYTCPSTLKRINGYAFYYTRDMGLTKITFNEGLEEIGQYAFAYNDSLSEIKFPSTLKRVEKGAFAGSATSDEEGSYVSPQGTITNASLNEGLEFIGEMAFANQYFKDTFTLPSTVTTIEGWAFANCTAIEKVVLPKALTSYAANAFNGSTGVAEFVIDGANTNFKTYNKMLFSYDMKTLISCPSNTYDDVTVPDGVENLGDYSFYMVDEVQNYTFPNSLKTIGKQAFAHTYNLKSFTIPDSVTSIGDNCFDLSGITSITIGSSLTSLPEEAFIETSLTSVTIPSNIKTIGHGAFELCKKLTSVTLEEGVEVIDAYAFSQSAVSKVNFPNSLKEIGNYAFNACSVTSLVIGDSLEKFGIQPFCTDGKTSSTLTDLSVSSKNNNFKAQNGMLLSKDGKTLVASISTVGTLNADSTRSVEVPSGVETIAAYAFAYARNISSITLPDGLKTIEDGAFISNTKLASITFPSSLTKIGDGVFYYANIASTTFNEGLLEIGESAFAMCDIESAKLPNSLKTIGVTAFARAMSLKSLTLGTGLESIKDHAFMDSKIEGTVTIPASVKEIGEGIFGSSSSSSALGQRLTEINVDESNANYSSENGLLMNKDKTIVYGVAGGIKSLTLPDSVTRIAPYGLSAQQLSIKSLDLNNVTYIDYGAFACSSNISQVSISNKVTYIGSYAFAYWTSNQVVKIALDKDYCLTNFSSLFTSNSSATFTYNA